MSARTRSFRGIVRWATVVSLAGVVVAMCAYSQERPPSAGQNQPHSTMRDVSEALARSVSDRLARERATCEFQAAFWGGYDAKVEVESRATTDYKPRIFKLTHGRFVETIITEQEKPREWWEPDRNGTVSLTSSEEAFRRGVPFFISDAQFESHDVVRYTVLSNPEVHVERAAGRYEVVDSNGVSIALIDAPQSFPSSPEPRVMRFNLDADPFRGGVILSIRGSSEPQLPKGEDRQVLLSVVVFTRASSFDREPSFACLVSNEIDLKKMARPEKPKP